MASAQRLLELGIALRSRLDEHRVLLVVLQRALPAIDRATRREDVDAGRQVVRHHRVGESLGRSAIWQVGQYEERAHGAFYSPRYASRTRGLSRSSRASPESVMPPDSIT